MAGAVGAPGYTESGLQKIAPTVESSVLVLNKQRTHSFAR